MTELPTSNLPPPRTPEQHAAVRRRSLPVAVVANVVALAALALLLSWKMGVQLPPHAVAAELSCCAVLMGASILFYARPTPGTTLARVLSITATLLGLIGPAVYSRQSIQWRVLRETTDLQYVADIARAAEILLHFIAEYCEAK